MGKIRFGHTKVAVLLGGDSSTLPTVLAWVAAVRDLIFGGYKRAQVFSADRAGILGAGSLISAVKVQTKLSVGRIQMREVRIEAIIAQACKVSRGISRAQAKLVDLQSTTPPLIFRLEAMVAWAGFPPLRTW
jgi:hypothetical protein